MGRRKIGWRIRLKRQLRQDRAEEKIRSKDLAKRQEQQASILGDTDIDSIRATSAKIGAAENQLTQDGYVPSGDPMETMTMYNDVYGDGNPEEIQQSLQDCFDSDSLEEYENNLERDGENFDESLQEDWNDSYGEVLHSAGDILDRFNDNFDENYNGGENFQDETNHFGERIKKWFTKVKTKIEGATKQRKEKRAKKHAEKIREQAGKIENVSTKSPDQIESVTKKTAETLKHIAKDIDEDDHIKEGKTTSGGGFMTMLIAGFVGVMIGKAIK